MRLCVIPDCFFSSLLDCDVWTNDAGHSVSRLMILILVSSQLPHGRPKLLSRQ